MIYYKHGNTRNLIDKVKMEDELEEALNKETDAVFTSSNNGGHDKTMLETKDKGRLL